MGMYNEVFSTCPDCGGNGYMQIGQIVMGFGGFNIDRPSELAEDLNETDLIELYSRVVERDFVCQNCNLRFNRLQAKNLDILARRLFG